MTTLIPTRLTRRTNEQPAAELVSATVVQPLITVNLLPTSVQAMRRVRHVRRRLLFALVALAVLIGLGYALTWQQTRSVSDQLSSEEQHIAALNRTISSLDPIVSEQSKAQSIKTLLSGAMATDVTWSTVFRRLSAVLPSGVALSGITANVTGAPGATSGTSTAVTDPAAFGTLTVTGLTSSYGLVAQYAQRLSQTSGFIDVQPASINGSATGTSRAARAAQQFTINLSFTKAFVGTRFAAPATTANTPSVPGAASTASTPAEGH